MSFRKYVETVLNSNIKRPVWSEMAQNTRFDTSMGGLPVTQGLANVVSITCKRDSDRLLLFKWMLNDGLYQAVQFRQAITEWALGRLDISFKMPSKPPAVSSGVDKLKRAMGEANQWLSEARRVTDDPRQVNLDMYRDMKITPLDIFSDEMREKIPELGHMADQIDRKWFNEFESKVELPIFNHRKIIGAVNLVALNQNLEERGYEGFYYGGVDGYLAFAEKGDWLPDARKVHWEDPGQRHGPDLNSVTELERDGEPFYVFDNIGTPQDEKSLLAKVRDLKRHFVYTVKVMEEDPGNAIKEMHRDIYQGLMKGDFEKRFKNLDPSQRTNYSQDQFGVSQRQAYTSLPPEQIEELVQIVDIGLRETPFQTTELEYKLEGFKPETIAAVMKSHDFSTNTFILSDTMASVIEEDIFSQINFDDLESEPEWPVKAFMKWKAIWKKSPLGKDDPASALIAKKWGEGKFYLERVINQTLKKHPNLSSDRVQIALKKFSLADSARKMTLKFQELTPEGVKSLADHGYMTTRGLVPDDIGLLKAMIQGSGRDEIVAKKGTHRLVLRFREGKFLVGFPITTDQGFDLGADNQENHMLGVGQMPVSLSSRMMSFPARTKEAREEFIQGLQVGEFGERGPKGEENVVSDPRELESVDAAAKAAYHQYDMGGRSTRGAIEDAEGHKVQVALSKKDIEDKFGGLEGLKQIGVQALKALSGHFAMKWGFILDDHFDEFTRFDQEEEVEKDLYDEEGRGLRAELIKVGLPQKHLDTIINVIWGAITEGRGPTVEDFRPVIAEGKAEALHQAVMVALGRNAMAARKRLIKNYILSYMRKAMNAEINTRGVQALNLVDSDSDEGGSAAGALEAGQQVKGLNLKKHWQITEHEFEGFKNMGFILKAPRHDWEEWPDDLEELEEYIEEADPQPIVIRSPKADEMNKRTNLFYLYKGEIDDPEFEWSADELKKLAPGHDKDVPQVMAYVYSGRPPYEAYGGEDADKGQIKKADDSKFKKGTVKPDTFGKEVDQDFEYGNTLSGVRTRSGRSSVAGAKVKADPEVKAALAQPRGVDLLRQRLGATNVGGPSATPEAQPQPAATQPRGVDLLRQRLGATNVGGPSATPEPTEAPQQSQLRGLDLLRQKLSKKDEPEVTESTRPLSAAERLVHIYKNWISENSAVYDPKVKVKDGCGFNWFGAVGKPMGTSIGGEVETANEDPDGTKGIKKNGRKKCSKQ